MIIRPSLCFPTLLCRPGFKYSNYYDLLEVDYGASQQEIKKKFYELAKRYHPDNQDGNQDPSRFIKIKEAYDTLGDEKKRMKYDNSFSSRYTSANESNFYEASYTQTRKSYSHPQYYEYEYVYESQSWTNLLKNNWLKILFAGIYFYMFTQIFIFFKKRLEVKDKEHRQLLLQNSQTYARGRRKYYSEEMKQKNIYGQQVDLKYRVLQKQSTRSLKKKKDLIVSIQGIEKEPSEDINLIVVKPEYI